MQHGVLSISGNRGGREGKRRDWVVPCGGGRVLKSGQGVGFYPGNDGRHLETWEQSSDLFHLFAGDLIEAEIMRVTCQKAMTLTDMRTLPLAALWPTAPTGNMCHILNA